MADDVITYARSVNRLQGRLGSYWAEGFADHREPMMLMQGAESEREFADTLLQALSWSTRSRSTVIRNRTIRWKDYHLLYLSVDRQKRIVTEVGDDNALVFSSPDAETYATVYGVASSVEDTDHVFGDEDNRLLFFPESDGATGGILVNSANLQPRYLLNIGRELEPTLIQSAHRMLVSGIDFYRSGDWLVFHQSMEHLFPDGKIHIRTGWLKRPDLYAYLAGTDGNSADMSALVRYTRKVGGVRNFARAALSVAGFHVLESPSRLLSVIDLNWPNKRYVYQDRVIQTRYPHRADNTGVEYPAGHVPGSVARVFSRRHTGVDWWKRVNWSDGFPLMGGLVRPTRTNIAFGPVEQVGAKFHIRNTVPGALGGTPQDENAFWAAVHESERRTDAWLNDILDEDSTPVFGFTDMGDDPKNVRFLDILMQHTLRNRVVAFEIDRVALTEGDKTRFEHYIHEERPADVLSYVRYRQSDTTV